MIPMTCLVFRHPPKDFASHLEVASCYCFWNQQLLLLQRHSRKSHGNTWGVPAGKLENGETAIQAIRRELFEEIGVSVKEEQLKFLATLYIRQAGLDFLYHMFYLSFEALPFIALGLDEHQDYQWMTFQEALKMPLMPGETETLTFIQQALHQNSLFH